MILHKYELTKDGFTYEPVKFIKETSKRYQLEDILVSRGNGYYFYKEDLGKAMMTLYNNSEPDVAFFLVYCVLAEPDEAKAHTILLDKLESEIKRNLENALRVVNCSNSTLDFVNSLRR